MSMPGNIVAPGVSRIAAAAGDSSEDAVVAQVRRSAQRCFDDCRGSHDWEHTLRVSRLCRRIGRVEQADTVVLMAAAYLHDIGRCHQDKSNGALCHAEKGAQMARPIVEKLALSDSRKANIIHSIRAHRFRGKIAPETIEARVLFDADKLDAIGAVGVARAFLFAGEVGARLHNPEMDLATARPYSRDDTGFREYKIKLSKVKDRILTAEGTRLAMRRHAFMTAFFDRFIAEYEGKE